MTRFSQCQNVASLPNRCQHLIFHFGHPAFHLSSQVVPWQPIDNPSNELKSSNAFELIHDFV